MAILKPEEKIGSRPSLELGDPSRFTQSTAKGPEWKPTFNETLRAEARVNTVVGASYHMDKSPEQKAEEERYANDVLDHSSFLSRFTASLMQPENIGITLASFLTAGAATGPLVASRAPMIARAATTLPGRMAIASATNTALTATTEAALHVMQETRTAETTGFALIGAAALGAGFQAGGEAIGAGFRSIKQQFRGRDGVGPSQQALRQAAIDAGDPIEVRIGRAIAEDSQAPLAQHADALPTTRLRREVESHNKINEPHEVMGRDDSLSAARADPNAIIMNGPDVPAMRPLNDAWVETPDGKFVPGPKAQDSISPTAEKVVGALDAGLSKVFGDSMRTQGGLMRATPFQTIKDAFAHVKPVTNYTEIARSGIGQHQDLEALNIAFRHRNRFKLNEIRDKEFHNWMEEVSKLTPEQHLAARREWAARNRHLSDAEAYQQMDDMIASVAKAKMTKTGRNDAGNRAFSYYSRWVQFAHETGDRSPFGAAATASRRIRNEIGNPIVQRGNQTGVWNIDIDAPRAVSETYGGPRRWDVDQLARDVDADGIPAFVRDAMPFMGAGNESSEAQAIWRSMIERQVGGRLLTNGEVRPDFTKALTLDMLPNDYFRKYLDSDIFKAYNDLINQTSGRLTAAEKFGGATGLDDWMKGVRSQVIEEFQQKQIELRNTLTPEKADKAIRKLEARMKADMKELEHSVDEALGRSKPTSDTVAAVKQGTSMMLLGRSGFSQLSDFFSRPVGDLITKVIPNFGKEVSAEFKARFGDPRAPTSLQRENALRMGAIMENALDRQVYYSTHELLVDLEKEGIRDVKSLIRSGASIQHTLQGTRALADTNRLMYADEFSDRVTSIFTGKKAPTPEDVMELGRVGLPVDPAHPMFMRISRQLTQYAEEYKGVRYPQTQKWDDAEAAEFLMASERKWVDAMTATPDSTSRMIAERNDLGSVVFQYSSFVHSYLVKRLLPIAETQGAAGVAYAYLKIFALGYTGSMLRELAFGKRNADGDIDYDKVMSRALSDMIRLPSSIIMGAVKVIDSGFMSMSEMLGFSPYRDYSNRAITAAEGAGNRLWQIAKGTHDWMMNDEFEDKKKKRLLLNVGNSMLWLNTPLMELPYRALVDAMYGEAD